MRRALPALAIAAALQTSCTSYYKRMPLETVVLGGTGFAVMTTGMFVSMFGKKQCFDAEIGEDCSEDDTTNLLGGIFMATGFVTTAIGMFLMAAKR